MKFYITLFSLLLANVLWCQSEIEVEPFLPEIMSRFPQVRDITFSPSGGEIFFTAESPKHDCAAIFFITKDARGWSTPKIAPFSGQYRDIEPHFAGQSRLFFSSNRPKSDTLKKPGDYDIYYVDRATDGWGTPVNMGAPVNSDGDEFYPSLNQAGDIYFTSTLAKSEGLEDIYVSKIVDGKWQKPRNLGPEINSETYDFNSYITPDDSIILFSAYKLPTGIGGGDLYISKKDLQGNWQKAKHIDMPINSKGLDYCPYLDLKNNRLYFTSDRSNVKKWFEKPIGTAAFIDQISQYSNGLGRIYSIPFFVDDYFK